MLTAKAGGCARCRGAASAPTSCCRRITVCERSRWGPVITVFESSICRRDLPWGNGFHWVLPRLFSDGWVGAVGNTLTGRVAPLHDVGACIIYGARVSNHEQMAENVGAARAGTTAHQRRFHGALA